MSLREDLNLLAPRLRRYARALVGGCPSPNEFADGLVRNALRRAYETGPGEHSSEPDIQSYAFLIEANREHFRAAGLGAPDFSAPAHGSSARLRTESSFATDLHTPEKLASSFESMDALSGALCALKLEEREALLLVSLEGFGYAQAARILKISRPILIARLSRAREKLPQNLHGYPSLRRTKSRPSHLRVVK